MRYPDRESTAPSFLSAGANATMNAALAYTLPQEGSAASATNWLAAFALVAAAHSAVWYGFAHNPFAGDAAARPLPIVQVSLVTRMPPRNEVTPLQAKTVPPKPREIVQTPPDADAKKEDAPQEEYVEPIYSAAYLSNNPPAYPMAARRRGIEGTVVIRALIHDNGHCHHAALKKSSGHTILDKAALEAVKDWRFTPARRGGQTTVAWVDVPITFRLNN